MFSYVRRRLCLASSVREVRLMGSAYSMGSSGVGLLLGWLFVERRWVVVSTGPIEWMGEEPGHEVPATEMSGADGLIQPNAAEVGLRDAEGMEIGHVVDASEARGIATRASHVALSLREQRTGEPDDERVIDPHTGRELEAEVFEDVTGKPGREVALGEGLIQ